MPTSTFPYTSVGPIDFSRNNFLTICQKDYYYASGTLAAEVTQCTNQYSTFWTIIGILALFSALLVAGAYFFAKKYRHG